MYAYALIQGNLFSYMIVPSKPNVTHSINMKVRIRDQWQQWSDRQQIEIFNICDQKCLMSSCNFEQSIPSLSRIDTNQTNCINFVLVFSLSFYRFSLAWNIFIRYKLSDICHIQYLVYSVVFRNICDVMRSGGISRKSKMWHFQFSTWLKSSLREVDFAEKPTWIGPVVPKL